jgi:hypothetical protein
MMMRTGWGFFVVVSAAAVEEAEARLSRPLLPSPPLSSPLLPPSSSSPSSSSSSSPSSSSCPTGQLPVPIPLERSEVAVAM